MEVIEEYLRKLCVVNGEPLSYIARKTLDKPVAAIDIDFGVEYGNYDPLYEEKMDCSSIFYTDCCWLGHRKIK